MLPLRLFCSLAASLCRTKPGTHRLHNAKNGAAPKGGRTVFYIDNVSSCLYACLRPFAAFPYEAACGGLKRRPPSERRSRVPFGRRSRRCRPAASPAERAQNPVCIQNRPRRRSSRKNGFRPPAGPRRRTGSRRTVLRAHPRCFVRQAADGGPRLPAAIICAVPSP